MTWFVSYFQRFYFTFQRYILISVYFIFTPTDKGENNQRLSKFAKSKIMILFLRGLSKHAHPGLNFHNTYFARLLAYNIVWVRVLLRITAIVSLFLNIISISGWCCLGKPLTRGLIWSNMQHLQQMKFVSICHPTWCYCCLATGQLHWAFAETD